jgi:hypothetical protein
MDHEHIVSYFKMLGVGGKPVGGPHENYGHGARVSLLPWNAHGIVVISRKDGEDSMIWMQRSPTGDYGLREWEVDGEDEDAPPSLSPVVEPYDDAIEGIDWRKVLPSWVKEHGTAFILLGNAVTDNTIDGDPRYPEEAITRGLHKYLGGRLMRLDSKISITVETIEELTKSRETRRATRDVALGLHNGILVGKHDRNVVGVEALLTRDAKVQSGEIAVDENGTVVKWFLRDTDAPSVSDPLPGIRSFIAFEYDDELYNHETHSAKFRMFGIAQEDVRARTFLIMRPPLYDPKTAIGVYPNQSRSSLFWRGGEPPVSEWALNFAKFLPEPIKKALADAYASDASTTSSIEEDKERREKLAARFGKRWRAIRYVISKALGTFRANPAEGQTPRRPGKPKGKAKKRHGRGGTGGSGGDGPTRLGRTDANGSELAVERRVGVDLPGIRWVPAKDLGEDKWAAAAFVPTDGPSGTILLNIDHPLFTTEIHEWQATRASHLADGVRETVQQVYADLAVAHVAHVRNFSGARCEDTIISDDIVQQMLQPSALTCALSGLLGAEAMIQTRLGGRFGKAA